MITPFKDINLIENEFLSFAVIIQKEKDQKIKFSYRQYADFMEGLYNEEMEESICKEIINNLTNALEYYVYLDIAKNPPDIGGDSNYHHKGINLQEELNKVSTKNRKFYEFYQEIETILNSPRDNHFRIWAYRTPRGIKFDQYIVHLPFDFIIKEYNGTHRIFIKSNDYINKYNQKVRQFINSHLEIPLKYINDIDPFEYIQKWSKYRRLKNIHAQFTVNIDRISSFSLNQHPEDYSDIAQNEYEFDDNKILRINYCNDDIDESPEFSKFYTNYLKNQIYSTKMPNIDEIKDKYLIFKGLKKEEKIIKEEKIKWDIEYNENNYFIKCRFDDEMKFNVLVQNSFNINLNNATSIIFDCARLFYSNNYPLVIIESNNGGGKGFLGIIMQQILQIRTADRGYKSSFRLSDVSKDYFKSKYIN